MVGFIGLKRASVKDSWGNYGLMLGAFAMSLMLLSRALETIALSTAYAVWAGIGTLGAAGLVIILYRESVSPLRIVAMLGVIGCIIGLRLTA
ncbi:DMT family transporter [Paenibacillus sp. 1P07SE]|uniref:DMT family transporter n=1 Tax=Paenibacillus sp. 1P07SE TaxID=3132209 RepID=UPI0039A6066A